MKHQRNYETITPQFVLSIEEQDVPPFVGKCLRERSLSTLIAELNADVLEGTPTEREEARKALAHIGFI